MLGRTLFAALALLLLPTPAHATPADGPTVVAGDSIVLGSGTTHPRRNSYPSQVGHWSGTRVKQVAHGAGCLVAQGCLYGPSLLDTYDEVLDLEPHRVVLSMGVNDLCHVPDSQLRQAYRTVLRINRDHGIPTVLTTITPQNSRWPWRCEVQRVRINDWLRATFPGRTVDVASLLETPNKQLQRRYDSGDGIHPNNAGARRMGRAVGRWLRALAAGHQGYPIAQ